LPNWCQATGEVHEPQRGRGAGITASRAAGVLLRQVLAACVPEARPRCAVGPDRGTDVVEPETIARSFATEVERGAGIHDPADEYRSPSEDVRCLGDVAIESRAAVAMPEIRDRYVSRPADVKAEMRPNPGHPGRQCRERPAPS